MVKGGKEGSQSADKARMTFSPSSRVPLKWKVTRRRPGRGGHFKALVKKAIKNRDGNIEKLRLKKVVFQKKSELKHRSNESRRW